MSRTRPGPQALPSFTHWILSSRPSLSITFWNTQTKKYPLKFNRGGFRPDTMNSKLVTLGPWIDTTSEGQWIQEKVELSQWMTGSRRARTIHPHSKASTSGKGAVFTKARQPLEFCARRSISASHDTAASSNCQNMGLVGSNLTQRDKLFVLALQLQHYKGHFMNDLSCYYECCKSRQTISVSLLKHKHNPFRILLQALWASSVHTHLCVCLQVGVSFLPTQISIKL